MSDENNWIIVLAVLIAVLLFGGFGMMGFGGIGYGMYGMMSWLYGGFGFMWVFGFILMSLFIIALVLLILWLIKQLGGKK